MEINEALIQRIVSDPWVVLIISLVAIVSLMASVIFYFKSKRDKIPVYGYKTKTLIEGLSVGLDGLEVSYKGVKQGKICVTDVIFWNAGHGTINRSDVAEGDLLRIEFPDDVSVLDIKMIGRSSSACDAAFSDEYKTGGRVCHVGFDYLDHNDYFIVQLVHNGSNESKFVVTGKIKGAKSIIESNNIQAGKITPSISMFSFRFIKLMNDFIETRYGGAITYAITGTCFVWLFHQTKVNKVAYLAPAFFYFSSIFMLFMMRHKPPVRF